MTPAEKYIITCRAASATWNEPKRIRNAVGARCIWSICTLRTDPANFKKIVAIACIRMQTFY